MIVVPLQAYSFTSHSDSIWSFPHPNNRTSDWLTVKGVRSDGAVLYCVAGTVHQIITQIVCWYNTENKQRYESENEWKVNISLDDRNMIT